MLFRVIGSVVQSLRVLPYRWVLLVFVGPPVLCPIFGRLQRNWAPALKDIFDFEQMIQFFAPIQVLRSDLQLLELSGLTLNPMLVQR